VARILSLDTDGSGFPAVGERDPVSFGGPVVHAFPEPHHLAAIDSYGNRLSIGGIRGADQHARA
jgi:hypothetical protein